MRRLLVKSGASTTSSRPPCPSAQTAGTPDNGAETLPSAETRRSRPDRSVTRKPPSGSRATAQGCSRPEAMVVTPTEPSWLVACCVAKALAAGWDAWASCCCARQAERPADSASDRPMTSAVRWTTCMCGPCDVGCGAAATGCGSLAVIGCANFASFQRKLESILLLPLSLWQTEGQAASGNIKLDPSFRWDDDERERQNRERQTPHEPRRPSTVAGRLQLEQFGIAPALFQQLFVRAARLQLPFGEHQDAVGHAHAAEAVRNQHGRLALR